jgi:enoyl-CoA hydratase/carnithine racemase
MTRPLSVKFTSWEMMGFCPVGDEGRFIESGATMLDGKSPINTSGGLVSKGHPIGATGVSMIAEIAAQLRGGYLNVKTRRFCDPDTPLSKDVLAELDPLDIAQKRLSVKFFRVRQTRYRAPQRVCLRGRVYHGPELIAHVKKQALQLIPPLGPELAVKMAKQAMHAPFMDRVRATLDRENSWIEKAVGTEDFKEFVNSRSEKRRPVYQGH